MSSQFEQFLNFCESRLTSSKEILKLAWKRYKECNEEYKNSESFSELILVTESKISNNKHRIFVHLRDFLQHLKQNKDISDYSNKRRLCGSSSEIDSDSNPPKRRRTIENSPDASKNHSSGTHSEKKDSIQHDEVNHVNIPVCSEESENSSGSVWRHYCSEQGQSKQELNSEKDDPGSSLFSNVPSGACTNMYSSSEEDNDENNETIKHIRDIIECNSDDNVLDHNSGIENKLNICENVHSDKHEEVSGSEENKNHKDADIISVSKDHSVHFRKNQINSKNIPSNEREDVASNSDSEGSDGEVKACTDNEIESDSLLEFCSVNLKPSVEKSVSNRVIDNGENTKQTDLDNEDSDVHVMIISDNEDDASKPNSFVLNKTEDFAHMNGAIDDEDCAGYDADKENRKLADRKVDTSSDEEDSAYAEMARKYREKWKKKYVVSTGSKKRKDISQPNGSKATKTEKLEKSPKKKKVKKRSPKKSNPSKSPIIIFTDSESCSDFEDNIKTVEKKVDEKIVTKFKKEFDTGVGTPLSVVDKCSTKVKQNLDGDAEGTNQCKTELPIKSDSCCSDKDLAKSPKSELEKSDLECEVDKDKTDGMNKSEDNYVNIKRRVDFVTVEKFEMKDVVVKDHNGDFFESEFKNKTRDKSCDIEDNTGRIDDGIEQPKPSTSCSESKKKKASNKQIKKLEQLLESIRNQIENVRKRELDLDDLDSDISDYILEDKLQQKFMKVWNKLCELHQAVKTTGRPTDKYFRYEGTRYPDINRKIEKFINKKKAFPDYHDVRSVIIKVNKDKRLHLRSREIDDLSKEAFTDVGNQLQKRRQKDFVSTFQMPGAEVNAFSLYDDPALYDPELKKKLDANKKAAKNKMDQVVEKYAQLQYQVDDKTDDDDDDDEDDDEENADRNTGTEDIDQLISGVDNTDSDMNDDNMFDDNNGLDHKINETSPCLEIENLENGWKSMIHPNLPLHKIGQSSPNEEPEKHQNSPKSQHFSEVLGLSVRKKMPDITILSDNDDDNEVKCDGSTLEDVMSDIEDEQVETYEKTTTNIDITIITDDEEDEPLGLKIEHACHVSLNDLDKIHKEGICSDMEPINDIEDLEEGDTEDCLKSVSEATNESLPDIESGDSCQHENKSSTSIETLPVKVKVGKSEDKVLEDLKNSRCENRKNEPDLDFICVEKNNFESKLSLSSEHMQAKCSSKMIHSVSKPDHKTHTSPEIVCLDSEESVIPSSLLTSENTDKITTFESKDVVSIASNSLPENNEDVELIEDDDVVSEVSEMEDSDTGSIMVATALKNPRVDDTDFNDINDDNNENIPGELNEDLVNGGSDSVSDVFASYENEGDMETECDIYVEKEQNSQETICQEISADESMSNPDDEVEEVNNEESDQLNNTSSCDIETIASKNIQLPYVKSKLLQLGTAITSQPNSNQSQDSTTQGGVDVINLSEPSTSRWNEYDENAGIIETYEEPDIHVTPINQDNVIVLSDSE